MSELLPTEIRLTPDFKKQVRKLERRYHQLRSDLQPVLEQLQSGEIIGVRLQGVGAEVFKARIRNSDAKRGKSGGYRLIYWLKLPEYTAVCIVMRYSSNFCPLPSAFCLKKQVPHKPAIGCIILLDIYSKSDRDDVEVETIKNIITEFEKAID